MSEDVKKEDVEELLGIKITDGQFEEALTYARRKQEHIYRQENRLVVLQSWYLAKLTEEYVRSLALSRFTAQLCEALREEEQYAEA